MGWRRCRRGTRTRSQADRARARARAAFSDLDLDSGRRRRARASGGLERDAAADRRRRARLVTGYAEGHALASTPGVTATTRAVTRGHGTWRCSGRQAREVAREQRREPD